MGKSINFKALDTLLEDRLEEEFGYRPEERPLVRAAVFTATFRESELITRVRAKNEPVSERDISWLREHTRATPGRRWEISLSTRQNMLAEIEQTDGLWKVQERYGPKELAERADDLFGRLLRVDLETAATVDDAKIVLKLLGWLDKTELGKGYHALHFDCTQFIERDELLGQMTRHTKNFSGRDKELRTLYEYVYNTTGSTNPLLIYGIGGIGKSTLVSKFILDHGILTGSAETPFVYLDFDRAGFSIAEPIQLAIEALRQLMLQFPVARDIINPLAGAQADFIAFAERSDDDNGPAKKVSQSDSRRFVLFNMAERYLKSVDYPGPILIVLDSFEEAQLRASEGELRNLLDFLEEIRGYLPTLRLLIVGRSDLVSAPFAFQELEVPNFDADAADAYLENSGVADQELRKLIFDRVGGNPLNLKLAAALAAAGVSDVQQFLQDIDETKIQEQLVRRNLHHIPDKDARELAEPGLLMRRISPEIIRLVMAEPCGLGDISEFRAHELYNTLRRITFLVEDRNGIIQFRRDVRMALREAVWARSRVQAEDLMSQAIRYYRDRQAPEDQAEYLYYRLQREDPAFLDELEYDWPTLRPFLESALTELPPDAAALLGMRFNLRVEAGVTEQQSDASWEQTTAAKVARGLLEGTTVGVLEDLWREMADHETDNGYFNVNRAELALRLGHVKEVRRRLEKLWEHSTFAGVSTSLKLDNYLVEDEHFPRVISALPNLRTEDLPWNHWYAFVETSALLAKAAGLGEVDILPIAENLLAAYRDMLRSILATGAWSSEDRPGREEPPYYSAIPYHGKEPAWQPIRNFRELRTWDIEGDFDGFWDTYLDTMRAITRAYRGERDNYLLLFHQFMGVSQEDFSQQLYNDYDAVLSDVSWPSVWEIARVDAIDFLMAFHRGDLSRAVTNFFPVPESSAGSPLEFSDEVSTKLDEFEKIRNLLAEAQTGEAIDMLRNISSEREHRTTMTLMASRYNRLQKSVNAGTISGGEASLERNQITMGLLNIVDDLEKEG